MSPMPRVVSLLVSLLVLSCPGGASAQDCGQEARAIDYGSVRVGTPVVTQRHRFVGGDPNWDPRMARFIGRAARVTRLSGVDRRGCPGVRIDADGGRFFWRLRDLVIEGVSARGARVARDAMPEACGLSDRSVRYGPLRVGSVIVLGRHRAVGGDDNWTHGMSAFVGRRARVTELAGADERGCPGVRVDVDSGEWFWRLRDLRLAEEGGPELAWARGVASDHGRGDGSGESDETPEVDARVPQMCGLSDQSADYGPVRVGSEVVLGRHRAVEGETNWVEPMDEYVGRRARVTELVGVDEQGCPLLRVDLDQGEWFWRLRDARLPP